MPTALRRSMAALISERWNAKGLWGGGKTLTKIGVLSAYAAPRTHRHVARSELPRADSRCDLHAYPSPSQPPAGSAIGGNPGVAGPMRIPPTSQLQTLGPVAAMSPQRCRCALRIPTEFKP